MQSFNLNSLLLQDMFVRKVTKMIELRKGGFAGGVKGLVYGGPNEEWAEMDFDTLLNYTHACIFQNYGDQLGNHYRSKKM